MTYFLKNGNTFRVSSKEAMDLHDTLPAGNYVIKQDQFENLYLEQIDSFKPLTRIYGDTVKHTQRVITTFKDRPGTTGVMLAGEKGSGKTLLSKNVSIELAKEGMPTIVVNHPWHGEKFNTLLQTIEQPVIVLFDEFEKVYGKDEQESILTLLDGVYSSKKLFVLTCNDKWRIDQHMRNRPGRIYYMLDFRGLTTEFITEYCLENLSDQSHIDKICSIATLFSEFNFDMLKALVEEMNRFDEGPQDALKMLNAKPEFDSGSKYDVKLLVDAKDAGKVYPDIFEGNPLARSLNIQYETTEETPDEDGDLNSWTMVKFYPSDLKRVDTNGGRFIFENGSNKVVLTKIREQAFNYNAF